jgi:DNA-binding SARP family transcriptional activator
MRFDVLGPLEIADGDRPIPLRSLKQRVLMAVLLCEPNREIPAWRLVDALWEGQPPPSADENLRVYVHRLRRAVGGDRIVHQRAGYAVALQAEELDSHRFERLVEQGRADHAAGGDCVLALRQALALWRGPAFAGLDGVPMLRERASRLEELRLAALELRIDADLAGGRHAELVPELSALAAEHPLREWFHAQLMLALHRSGRQAEALAAYREARRLLVAELGIEPSRQLQRLEQAILMGLPELDPSRSWSSMLQAQSSSATVSAPCTLPADIPDFTGRRELVEQIVELATASAGSPVVAIIALSGAAGIGKSVLAVHAAHRLRSRFPGGQLYANLRGFDLPLEPATVLGRFLRSVGVDGTAIPRDLDERAELYRALVADRTCLVVLDNVADADQVRPLLPGVGAAVMVTSRRPLADLDGACHLRLGVFDEAEAIALIAAVSGHDRVDSDRRAAAELARACGYLPLAVRISAARLGVHRHWSVANLAASMAGGDRLDQLSTGGLDLRASLALSYEALSAEQRRAFRLLALLDAASFPAWACAAATGTDPTTAEKLVEAVADCHLLEVAGIDLAVQTRYRYHDLVRLYARERCLHEDDQTERRAALTRMVAAWLTVAERADQLAFGRHHRPPPGGTGRWQVDRGWMDGLLQDPRAWLESERGAVVTQTRQACTEGLDDPTWELAASVDRFFETRGYLDDWRATHEAALVAATRGRARGGQPYILWRLGELELILDSYDQALAHCDRAAALLERSGNAQARALVLVTAGLIHRLQGRLERAASCCQKALDIFGETGDRAGLAQALHSLGAVRREQGSATEALACFRQALRLFEDLGDQMNQALATCNLGSLHRHLGRLEQAKQYLERSLALARQSGFSQGEAYAQCYLGELYVHTGRHREAGPRLDAALERFQQLGDRFGEALALRGLGGLHIAAGHHDMARAHIAHAHQIWDDLGLPLWSARALAGLGDLHEASGDDDNALAAWSQAHAIFQRLDVPEAGELADRLQGHTPAVRMAT